MPHAHLAIDLGASSGRAILGVLEGAPLKLSLQELHRFEHLPCPTPVGPIWDLTGIWLNILQGLRLAGQWCRQHDVTLVSIGVDAWGVDWVLTGTQGELLGGSHCYRDPRNEAAVDRVWKAVGGPEALYRRTGIQHMAINTLFQIEASWHAEPRQIQAAERLLFVPDLFHYWLSGQRANERTIASTSGLLSVETGDWDRGLLDTLGIPSGILGPLVDPGTVLGPLRSELAGHAGVPEGIQVVTPGAHDTASAVAAVPTEAAATTDAHPRWAYLSSGTWSLLGAELACPAVSEASSQVPFTHERGLQGTIRFLKNIGGLWLVQELRREMIQAGQSVDFAQLTRLASEAQPFRTVVNPNASEFAAPGDMARKIQAAAQRTGQPVPETPGQLVRTCLDSLGLCYRDTIESLEGVLGTSIEVLHIVGGGVQNELLNRISCGVLGRPVICGPVEATAVGNLLTQAMGLGQLADLPAIREVVRQSFSPVRLEPADLEDQLTPDPTVMQRYRQACSA